MRALFLLDKLDNGIGIVRLYIADQPIIRKRIIVVMFEVLKLPGAGIPASHKHGTMRSDLIQIAHRIEFRPAHIIVAFIAIARKEEAGKQDQVQDE